LVNSKSINVLFVCSGNSGRSIMAEAILNSLGKGTFNAFSAGSHPTGRVNPFTVQELHRRGYSTVGLSSKSWTNFAAPESPRLDFVITVCANAAAELPPEWPGSPRKLKWIFRSPGEVAGELKDVRSAFEAVCGEIEIAIKEFILNNQAFCDPE
jgi:arsenate reductase